MFRIHQRLGQVGGLAGVEREVVRVILAHRGAMMIRETIHIRHMQAQALVGHADGSQNSWWTSRKYILLTSDDRHQ